MERTGIIIVAGGSGNRMGAGIPKQFLPLAGREILVRTLERFLTALPDAQIVVVLPESEHDRWHGITGKYGLEETHKVCTGGADRYSSVRNGLAVLGECDLVAVHDGVRPLVSEDMIHRCVELACRRGAAVPVVKPVDSFRFFEGTGEDADGAVVDRDRLGAIQTPQVFRSDALRKAYEDPSGRLCTDDASVYERYGGKLHYCEGERTNIKITSPEDIILAEAVVASQNS